MLNSGQPLPLACWLITNTTAALLLERKVSTNTRNIPLGLINIHGVMRLSLKYLFYKLTSLITILIRHTDMLE